MKKFVFSLKYITPAILCVWLVAGVHCGKADIGDALLPLVGLLGDSPEDANVNPVDGDISDDPCPYAVTLVETETVTETSTDTGTDECTECICTGPTGVGVCTCPVTGTETGTETGTGTGTGSTDGCYFDYCSFDDGSAMY